MDELVRRFLLDFEDKRMAIVSVDPSKRKTGGALLGDRIRMNAIASGRVYMRSLATRQSNLALSRHVGDALCILKAAGFDLIVLETSGIGQSDTEIMDHSDVALYVMTPEFGAATQLEKIDMLDFADVVAINKFDKRGGADALRDVRKQYKRNHELWEAQDDSLPIFGTIASQFNDPGTHRLYRTLMNALADKTGAALSSTFGEGAGDSEKVHVIPPKRTRYLSEIADSIRSYNEWTEPRPSRPDCKPPHGAGRTGGPPLRPWLARSGEPVPGIGPEEPALAGALARRGRSLSGRITCSKSAARKSASPPPPRALEPPGHSEGQRSPP